MQIGQREEEQYHPIEGKDEDKVSSAYSLFVYAVRSQITRDYHTSRCPLNINIPFCKVI
ncbi:MAG TPA: hypothetical protein VE076_06235 [Nitrososphaeraceae archaeon]|jgi:hypothetical protein|nr:hypothetical protein [Nitrososphaeraceae archaeon]